jgi:hypothetical protein
LDKAPIMPKLLSRRHWRFSSDQGLLGAWAFSHVSRQRVGNVSWEFGEEERLGQDSLYIQVGQFGREILAREGNQHQA